MPRFLHFSSDLNHTSFILQGVNISGISQGIHRMKNSFGVTIISINLTDNLESFLYLGLVTSWLGILLL